MPLVLSTRVSTLGDDVVHGWDPAACAAGHDGDGIMLTSAMAERAPGQSLPTVAGAVTRAIPRCIPSAFLSSLAHHPQNGKIMSSSCGENFVRTFRREVLISSSSHFPMLSGGRDDFAMLNRNAGSKSKIQIVHPFFRPSFQGRLL